MQKVWLDRLARTDWILLGSVFTLTAIGLLMIYGIGASYETVSLIQFRKQIIALIIGFAGLITLSIIDFRQIKILGTVIYVFGLLMLTSVLIFGVTIRGTRGWFEIGSITIQPVEIAKIIFAIFLASYFARHIHKRLNWITFFGSTFAMLAYVGLILLQPDFGSAMVIVVMWAVAIAFAGLRPRAWFFLISIATLSAILLWSFGLQPYQKDRITSFLNPQADPLGAGYNVIQAQTAIGSGGWFGKGVGEGSQSRLRFLPEASTDFMFAVMGEELGFVGIALVLTLFGTLLVRVIWIGYKSKDVFAAVYCVAIVGMFGMHVLVNAGMNMGVMPVTGIPLPFASAAASSLVAGFFAIGLVQSIVVHASHEDQFSFLPPKVH
ncbi:rod shape-determining protein RodA [Patescibacteria group bacterium]|nr:rod shape-determining protein RodA [Patescibacteria group bacterium]